MKSRVFTERERRRLKRWLETEEEDDTIRMLFVEMRQNAPRLIADLELFFQVRRRLVKSGRWKRRLRGKRRSEFLSRLGVSASTLKRNGRST